MKKITFLTLGDFTSTLFPWKRVQRLRKALDISTDRGIYPKSIQKSTGEYVYKKRTRWMEEMNKETMSILEKISTVLKRGDWK